MSKVILFPIERRRPDIKKGKGRVREFKGLMNALEKHDYLKAWEIINGEIINGKRS